MAQSKLPVRDVVRRAVATAPQPLSWIYDFVRALRPGTAPETIRARIYEALERGEVVRVAAGVYYARRNEGQLLVIEGDAWEVLRGLPDDALDALVTDPPGRFGRNWAGTGTTRPHSALGGRTYAQPELDRAFLQEAYRALKKSREWRTLKKGDGPLPRGGAACIIRVPLENRTTRAHVQALIHLAEEAGFVYYGEIVVALDVIGMGYHAGRDKGAKWLLFHAGERKGVLWDLAMPNVLHARRLRNPAKAGAPRHEAEKDAAEVLPLLRAVLRPGETVLDCFAGAASWIRHALAEGYNVLAVERQAKWAEAIAHGRPTA